MKAIGKGDLFLLVFTVCLVTCSFVLSEEIANDGKTEYTFLWFIENYSYCWHKDGEGLFSPEFTAKGLEGTVWSLELNPRGYGDDSIGHISLFLQRSEVDDGPEDFPLLYEMAILTRNGSALISYELDYTFRKGMGFGYRKLLQINEELLKQKADYLPQDTLKVRCKIWIGEGDIRRVKQIHARTRIGIEQISFLHEIEGFSAILPNQNNTVEIVSPSKKGLALSSILSFSDDSFNIRKVQVEITPSDSKQILSRCKLSLLDTSGKVIPCGEDDNRFGDIRKNILKLPLSFARLEILNRKKEFLPNDKLSLLWEGVFATGIEYERIESTQHEIPFLVSKHITINDQKTGIYDAAKKLSTCSSALEDLVIIYTNQFLTDAEVKTRTKSFPAHRIVLCARSPVFNSTLTNDMTSRVIQVDDLEDDTVRQLLHFLYADDLKDLKWESAIKLYYAADRYKIGKLKVMCSSFLLDNLTPSSASEVLLLADDHKDSDLKTAVEDFIFKNEEQVFLSEEWGSLIETNPVLVSKTMRQKYMRKL